MSAQPVRFASRARSLPTGNEREFTELSETFLTLLGGAYTDGRAFAHDHAEHPAHGRRALPAKLEQQERYANSHLSAHLLRAALCLGAAMEFPDLPPHARYADVHLDQELACAWLLADPCMRPFLHNFVAHFGLNTTAFESRWNGIFAVVRTIRAALAAGLKPYLPNAFEDGRFNIDLFVARGKNDLLVLQIEAQARGFFVHTFSRERDLRHLSPTAFSTCVQLLDGAHQFARNSGTQVTPTYVACGSLTHAEEMYFARRLSDVPINLVQRRAS